MPNPTNATSTNNGATVSTPVSPRPRPGSPTGHIVTVPVLQRPEVWLLVLLLCGAILTAGYLASGSKASNPVKVNVAAPAKSTDSEPETLDGGAGIVIKGKSNRVTVNNAVQDNGGLRIDGDSNNLTFNNGNGVKVKGRTVTVTVNTDNK